MGKTTEAFRLIVQRWPKLQSELFDPDPYCYRAIATNREEKVAEVVVRHNQRGEGENNLKELILSSFQNETNYDIMSVWQDRRGLMLTWLRKHAKWPAKPKNWRSTNKR